MSRPGRLSVTPYRKLSGQCLQIGEMATEIELGRTFVDSPPQGSHKGQGHHTSESLHGEVVAH